ncbi:hypothetical protein BKA00_002470 [Actinomadura coerulea]|uniref:Uncharacterized protein n=1 Tax=Actinomadura coerulea TaxID=46159 RepID=A0A7X0FXI7_9ACTN|nr:hypothetical protein [Actinomadura coerulea]
MEPSAGEPAPAGRGGAWFPPRDHTIAKRSKNYRHSTDHQVVIDAGTRLVVVVDTPLARNRNHCKAWEESDAMAAVGKTTRPTADAQAPDWSSSAAASAAEPNSRTGRKNTTSSTGRSAQRAEHAVPGMEGLLGVEIKTIDQDRQIEHQHHREHLIFDELAKDASSAGLFLFLIMLQVDHRNHYRVLRESNPIVVIKVMWSFHLNFIGAAPAREGDAVTTSTN